MNSSIDLREKLYGICTNPSALANGASVELEARRCTGQVGSASVHRPSWKRVGAQAKLEALRRKCPVLDFLQSINAQLSSGM